MCVAQDFARDILSLLSLCSERPRARVCEAVARAQGARGGRDETGRGTRWLATADAGTDDDVETGAVPDAGRGVVFCGVVVVPGAGGRMYSSRSLRRAAACDRLGSAVVCFLRRSLAAGVRVVASTAEGERHGGDDDGVVTGDSLLVTATRFAQGAGDALKAGFRPAGASAWACAEQCLQAWVANSSLDSYVAASNALLRAASAGVQQAGDAGADTRFARAMIVKISELSDDRRS